jgi:hypothetical protein
MFTFVPVNKLLLVEKLEEKKKREYDFYVPEQTIVNRNTVVKLLRAADGSPYSQFEGANLVVQTQLIDIVDTGEQKFLVVSETGVVGILRKNEL